VRDVLADRDDAELVSLVAEQHRDALAELYRRHAAWLTARLRNRCADDGVVAEAQIGRAHV
jgi:hypothetical protein